MDDRGSNCNCCHEPTEGAGDLTALTGGIAMLLFAAINEFGPGMEAFANAPWETTYNFVAGLFANLLATQDPLKVLPVWAAAITTLLALRMIYQVLAV